MGIIIDLLAIIIVLSCAFIAYKKGFVKTFFGFISTILAIVIACCFCNTLSSYIKNETQIDDWIVNSIISINGNDTEENEEKNIVIEDSKDEIDNNQSEQQDEENLVSIIDSLPNTLNEIINLDEIKEEATLSIVNKITDIAINILSWLILYAIAKIVLAIITIVFHGIMSIPFLKTINNLAGLIIGAIMGFFRIYFILALIYFVSNILSISGLVNAIQSSIIVAHMYNSNLLINLIF